MCDSDAEIHYASDDDASDFEDICAEFMYSRHDDDSNSEPDNLLEACQDEILLCHQAVGFEPRSSNA